MDVQASEGVAAALGLSVVYLDLDGTLHCADVRLRHDAPYIHSPPGHEFFEHAELLVQLLAPYPDVRIVISSSWVRHYGYAPTVAMLPRALQERCIGSTWVAERCGYRYDISSRGEQVLADVHERAPRAWLAIDDDTTGWGWWRTTHLVATDKVDGIAEPVVRERLEVALRRFAA